MTNNFHTRVRLHTAPHAVASHQITHDRARFSLLTPRLLRMEYAPNGDFEDRATFAFPSRSGVALPDPMQAETHDAAI
jgi:hypothetical protein